MCRCFESGVSLAPRITSLVIVLVETDATPPAVLVHLPEAPSVAIPPRFPALALAVIARNQAMRRLAEMQGGTRPSSGVSRSEAVR